MRIKYIYILFSFLCLGYSLVAQNNKLGIIEDGVFNSKIKTVRLTHPSSDMVLPIIDLNSSEKLLFQFDELGSQTNSYRYRIQHCTADWKLSDLNVSQYIDGFDDLPITNQQYSFNTIQHYVNYYEKIPNDMTTFKVSGNYIVTVYPEGDEGKPICVKRFMVKEEGMIIKTTMNSSSNVEFRDKQQEIQVVISPLNNLFLGNPSEYVKLYVQQNGRRDQKRLMPLHSITGNNYQYIWKPENIFDGGNEFRALDLKNIRIRSRYVEKLDYINGENHVYLLPEKNKSKLPYYHDDDINGKSVIHADYAENINIEGDYAWVHFLLSVDAPRLDGGFYLVGNLTNWYLDDNSKMIYNEKLNAYIAALYLKQGYYNYQILFKRVNSLIGEESAVEGNHMETENDYTVFVYYKRPGELYDRLVGVSTINSVKENK